MSFDDHDKLDHRLAWIFYVVVTVIFLADCYVLYVELMKRLQP